MVLAFEEEVLRVICAYAPQVGRSQCKKDQFYGKRVEFANPDEVVLGLRGFNGHVGRRIDGFEDVHGGYGIGKMLREEDYSSFVMKRSCTWQIYGLKRSREN